MCGSAGAGTRGDYSSARACYCYAAWHDPFEEWVYNEADIDSSKIVWAREMDASCNRKLLAYFHNRHAWLLEPDEDGLKLSPYVADSQSHKEVPSPHNQRGKEEQGNHQ